MKLAFKGAAARIDDYDIPRIGATIGVGEDELHAFMDVEAAGSGFDDKGRPKMLFEPHLYWRELGPGAKRDLAAKQGLAYPKWGTKPYPKESYTRLAAAMAIDEDAALKSASWGLTQILGKWHADIGYPTVQAMVETFAADEAAHLEATVRLLVLWKVDDDLRAHRWATVARTWNGEGYKKHDYDGRLKRAFEKWQKIRDTVWPPKDWKPPVEAPQPVPAPQEPPKAQPAPTASPDAPVGFPTEPGTIVTIDDGSEQKPEGIFWLLLWAVLGMIWPKRKEANMASQAQKQQFIGGIVASVLAKKGVEIVVEKALDKVAKKPSTDMTKEDVPKAAPVVVKELKEEVQARAEHQLDAEPHWQSRNVIGVILGLIGEGYILYTFWTDNIPQDFQADVVPHLMVIAGLLTPLYSRFVAKKPLFR